MGVSLRLLVIKNILTSSGKGIFFNPASLRFLILRFLGMTLLPKTMENQLNYDWIVRRNFAEADFWLINKGSCESLGKPVKQYEPFLTGIKCPVLILPDYGFYLCLYLYQMGLWKQYSIGSTNYKNLRLNDVKEVFQYIARQHRSQDKARFKSFMPAPVPAEKQQFYASL